MKIRQTTRTRSGKVYCNMCSWEYYAPTDVGIGNSLPTHITNKLTKLAKQHCRETEHNTHIQRTVTTTYTGGA